MRVDLKKLFSGLGLLFLSVVFVIAGQISLGGFLVCLLVGGYYVYLGIAEELEIYFENSKMK